MAAMYLGGEKSITVSWSMGHSGGEAERRERKVTSVRYVSQTPSRLARNSNAFKSNSTRNSNSLLLLVGVQLLLWAE